MKEAVFEVAKRIVFAALVFAVGFRKGYQSGKADCVPTDYGRLEYALDVNPEEWQDLPSVKEMADWKSRTNAPESGGWVAVGGKEGGL